jgi:hypothetical protein
VCSSFPPVVVWSSRVCLPAVEEAEVEEAEAMDMEMLHDLHESLVQVEANEELDMEKSCFVAKTDGMRLTRALDWNC